MRREAKGFGMGKLDGRVVLVTGAARGQGEQEARLFREEGAEVAVADVLDDQGRDLARNSAPCTSISTSAGRATGSPRSTVSRRRTVVSTGS
ncbi:hypothetical protein SALBM311S_12967 [Streptomyces alboniger]